MRAWIKSLLIGILIIPFSFLVGAGIAAIIAHLIPYWSHPHA